MCVWPRTARWLGLVLLVKQCLAAQALLHLALMCLTLEESVELHSLGESAECMRQQ